MISEKMQKALNGQINAELYSSYLYLSMASYFGSINLAGFESWMKVQAMEEMYHVMKFYNFIEERGGRPIMGAIDSPPSEWDSTTEVFEVIYAHEQKVSGLINELVDQAIEEKDHATNNFLQWFVAEQVEEEDSVNGVLQNLKLVDDKSGLLMLDRELGARAMKIPIDLKINLIAGA